MTDPSSQYETEIPKRGKVLIVAEDARHFSRYIHDNKLEKRAVWAHHEAIVRGEPKARAVIILNGAHKNSHYKEIMHAVSEQRDRTRGFVICRRNY